MTKSPQMLVILDGFGYSQHHHCNAIYHAHPKTFNHLQKIFPSSLLKAYGTHVGLIKGMIGNSEVGHLTIGSGRIIKQPVALLHEAIDNGSFFNNPLLKQRFHQIALTGKTVHFMGLLSDAGVHSHEYHLFAFLKMAVLQGVQNIIVHPFLDGRDTPPRSASLYLSKLDDVLKSLGTGIIGTINGRFYAMDRDHHWERIKETYDILTESHKPPFSSWQDALAASYARGVTDEFFVPCSLREDAYIKPGDGVVFFNFRADRARELTQALVDPSFSFFPTRPLHLSWMITATRYRPDFPVDVLLPEPIVTDTFLDRVELAQKRIFTIAETEKYAHITYFFNGGKEVVRQGETRILIPSKRHFETYAPVPCMSAPEITEALISSLTSNPHDFYLVNYANADMVGHSGDFEATCKAICCLDEQLKKLYEVVVEQLNGTLYITADHGKAEDMYDDKLQQPRTAHTSNKVPFLFIKKELMNHPTRLPLSELADVAPFILQQLGLPIPEVMEHTDNYS
jgi:2,3-bisphosphoglycerate-independent phosphoglycerate mutase